jgi:hypothetical protein
VTSTGITITRLWQVCPGLPDVLGAKELARILHAEQERGRAEGGRVKQVTAEELLRAGRGR